MNAASWGLVPRSAAEEAAGLMLRRNRSDGIGEEEIGRVLRRCRDAVARLLNVARDEIALAPNTSYGVNLGASLTAAGAPGRIVATHGEFPANVLPWKALESRGFKVELVSTDERGLPVEERLLEALDGDDVRALTVSAVQFATGFRVDLERLGTACAERNILFCVDAIQALGAIPIDARRCHIDILASGGQKWLCAPWGSGFSYIRGALRERFTPPMVGWLSVEGATHLDEPPRYDLRWLPDARKFEMATLGLQDYLGLARSIEIFLEMGLEAVRDHISRVQEPLLEWIEARADVVPITPFDAERRAGIVSFAPADPPATAAALIEGGVVFSARGRAIRLAPHYYNTVEEMERVVQVLDRAPG